jgi:hypothetical protein
MNKKRLPKELKRDLIDLWVTMLIILILLGITLIPRFLK